MSNMHMVNPNISFDEHESSNVEWNLINISFNSCKVNNIMTNNVVTYVDNWNMFHNFMS